MPSNRGARTSSGRQRPPVLGKFSETLESKVDFADFQLILFEGHEVREHMVKEPNGADPFDLVARSLTAYRSAPPLRISLTGMTVAELEKFREFINRAIEKALPIAEELDLMAKEAFKNGDDSFTRLYRTIPEIFIRKPKAKLDSEGLHDGPANVTDENEWQYKARGDSDS